MDVMVLGVVLPFWWVMVMMREEGSSKLSSQGRKPCRRKHDSHEKTMYARFQ